VREKIFGWMKTVGGLQITCVDGKMDQGPR
jgi:hypothetical protein